MDIISYSKKLAQKIASRDSAVGELLFQKYGEVQACVSVLIENVDPDQEAPNRYNNNFCNVGTNFKSGVSINKPNHNLIIILPPKGNRRTYKSINGIFSEGINSVIQSLARQRNVGDIHIILPYPLELNYDSLTGMTEEQKEKFQDAYNSVATPIISGRNNVTFPKNEIISFSAQKEEISISYQKLAQRLFEPMIVASKYNIDFPDKVEYTLEKAEQILTKIGFLGRDLACYVTYSAFTNQFYNAKLVGYNSSPLLKIEDIDPELERIYEDYVSNPENSGNSISIKYAHLKDKLLSGANSSFNSNQQRFVKEKIFKYLIDKTELENLQSDSFKYLVTEYNMLQSHPNQESENTIGELNTYIERFKSSIQTNVDVRYLKKYSENPIFENAKPEIFRMIQEIKRVNPALSLSNAKFFRDINEGNAGEKLYDYLIKNLFKTTRYRPILDGGQLDLLKIIETINYQNM